MGTHPAKGGGGKGSSGKGGKGGLGKGVVVGRVIGIGPKINESASVFYGENFKNINEGAKKILEVFPYLYREARIELKGIFNSNELRMLIAVVSEGFVFFSSRASGKIITNIALTSAEHAGLYDEFDVDKKILKKKINKLSDFQQFSLFLWCKPDMSVQMEGEAGEDQGLNIDEYIKELVSVED